MSLRQLLCPGEFCFGKLKKIYNLISVSLRNKMYHLLVTTYIILAIYYHVFEVNVYIGRKKIKI